jgi:uncharacterized protein
VSLPVAGWYPDLYRQARFRFWDGTKWTPDAAGQPVTGGNARVPPPGLPVAYGYAPMAPPPGPPVASGHAPAPSPPAAPVGYRHAPVVRSPRNVWCRLDERVAAMRTESAMPWGMRPILIPTLAFLAVIVGGGLLAALWNPTGPSRASAGLLLAVLAYAVIGAAVWYAGRPIARRHGGWAATFGWSRPTPADAVPVVPWLLANMAARLIAGDIIVRTVPAWRHARASNVNLHGRPTSVIIEALIVVAIIAPPIEELWFRGVILRTLMHRYPFWPAAIACSLMFGLFHTYQLDTLAGAALLGVSTAVFGLGQCLLVRRHVGLNTAIGVHSLNNFVVALLTLVVLTHS